MTHKVVVTEESGAAECLMCGTVVPSVTEWRKHLVEGCPGMNVPPSEMEAAYERARAMITPDKTVRRLRHVLKLIDEQADPEGNLLWASDLIRQALGDAPEVPENRIQWPELGVENPINPA